MQSCDLGTVKRPNETQRVFCVCIHYLAVRCVLKTTACEVKWVFYLVEVFNCVYDVRLLIS